MNNRHIIILLFFISCLTSVTLAQPLNIRIADVGAGLGTVTIFPDGKVMVYDAGRGSYFMPTLRELVPNKKIDLLVLSHNDADHIGGVPEIAADYEVKKVVYSTYREENCDRRPEKKPYCQAMAAIDSMKLKGTLMIPVTNSYPAAGTALIEGEGYKVTYLCGFDNPDVLWTFTSNDRPSKPRNTISVVIRLDYGDQSVLFGGDAVGKLEDSDECVYTEKYLLEHVLYSLLDADIMIAPHHGSENGSCDRFIKAVSPEYVIFSAGSMYGHPRQSTVQRYLENGIPASHMFRTDRGDDEKGKYGRLEWDAGRLEDCRDRPFDDDIQIVLEGSGDPQISYVFPDRSFCE